MAGKRVAVGMISHETNTFSPIQTPIEAFAEERIGILEQDEVLNRLQGTKTGIGGFLEVGAEQGWEMIGTVAASATPSANIPAEVHDDLKGRMIRHLKAAGPVDAVLLHLHGAMLSENANDAEGDICRAVREVIGPDIPLFVELDLHGNITAEHCNAIDGIFCYETNPHIDPYERGLDAARALADLFDGKISRPSVYISKPPMLPATINMRTAEGPMQKLMERAAEWEASPEIIKVGVFGGFPFADFDQAGTSMTVTATNPEIGRKCADDMGRFAWEIRQEFLKTIPPVEEAVEQALQILQTPGEGPVILADVADNPGGGGSGDTPELIRELVRRGATGAVSAVWDPETVNQARSVGIGGTAEFQIGGKADPAYGAPVEVTGTVRVLSDGQFTGHGPVVRGGQVNCGPTALIDVNGLQIVVVSVRQAANDRGHFKVVGIQPEHEPLLVIKSRGHFRADFEPIARTIIEVDAPGAANPNLERFTFGHVRRPIWPLDPDTTWDGNTEQ
jgi:microcystin degradation protein MlrC